MRQSTTWIALLCVLSLAGCATNASNCAGWQKISLKPETAVYLAGNDQNAGKGVANHNAYGKKAGCW
jgi:hypothetical protein